MTCYPKNITRVALVLIVVTGLLQFGCQRQRDHGTRYGTATSYEVFAGGKDRAPTPQTLYAMARLLTAREHDAKAEYVLLHLNEKHPDFLPAYIDLAELYMRRDLTDVAITTLERGLAIAPDNPVLLNDLGVCLMVNEDYAGALERFTAASEAAPRVRRYQTNRGVAMALMKDYDAALEVFLQTLPPEDAHHNLAQICMANGDESRAAEEMRLAQDKPEKH